MGQLFDTAIALLEKDGWTVECESPLEIRHEDGSFATLGAANILVQYYVDGNRYGNGESD